ncbi:hypothetical protein [Pseudomonas fontis]|uniref:Phosphatidylinositol diacylglycerol-lyase n=1 Tax=Pseudomonas fontis TaxID=2942633 RepID=A0ABT5NXV2_9PSED|nr:hypothetical protein [Pseudomonas fontis]MDD0972500.1 hypothetical protein [Pseudomonas fontis]MDD0993024.1 hypothetical protein [Pseudomonas fontis]
MLGTLVSQAQATETAPGINVLTKPFDEYTWVTAHNAYLNDMKSQLQRGIRGFLLDLKPGNLDAGGVYLCHIGSTCDIRSEKKFSTELNNTFLPFLKSNPNAVITLLLETRVDRAAFAKALGEVPQIEKFVFNPNDYEHTSTWPTLDKIIKSGKRIVLISDVSDNIGFNIVGKVDIGAGKSVQVLEDHKWETQNTYDLGSTSLQHKWACVSRWESVPMAQSTVNFSGFEYWKRLFVLNQFHSFGSSQAHAGEVDNNLTYLERRVDNYCAAANDGKRRIPNYLAIDFNQVGDALPYAAALSQGGIYLHEGNNGDTARDTTCVLPAGHNYSFKLAARGCENDEARSLSLRGIKKGTRITLYDSPTASQHDDYAVVDIKRDIGLEERVVVSSFERSENNNNFKSTYVRNNGLDGKVSYIKIEPSAPTDFSDASIALHEGDRGTENLLCTIPLKSSQSFDFNKSSGYRCDNDEARSATLLKARAGAEVTFYGDRGSSSCKQGCLSIKVKEDITSPVLIPSFEYGFDNSQVSVKRTGGTQQLAGKVSSARIHTCNVLADTSVTPLRGTYENPRGWSETTTPGQIHKSDDRYFEANFSGSAATGNYYWPRGNTNNANWTFRGIHAGTYADPKLWSEETVVGRVHTDGYRYFVARFNGTAGGRYWPKGDNSDSNWTFGGNRAGTYAQPKRWREPTFKGAIHNPDAGPRFEAKFDGIAGAGDYYPKQGENDKWRLVAEGCPAVN